MKETPKKAKFARLWRELGNASEAYRQSYDVRMNVDIQYPITQRSNGIWMRE